MDRYSENYRNTGSKSVTVIERDAYIVSTLLVKAEGSLNGFRHKYAFIVSKSRGRGVLRSVKKQCSTGDEIRQSLVKAQQNLDVLNQSMNEWAKPVQAAKKRVKDLAYMNSLLDSCFKGWR